MKRTILSAAAALALLATPALANQCYMVVVTAMKVRLGRVFQSFPRIGKKILIGGSLGSAGHRAAVLD